MKQLRSEIWAALHTRDTWIMIAIVAAVTFTLGFLVGPHL